MTERSAAENGHEAMLVIGLMSGTSLDGIDAALVEFVGADEEVSWRVRGWLTRPYSAEQRTRIHEAIIGGRPAVLCRLHSDLGEWFADAVGDLCRASRVDFAEVALIGSHGQTVWHQPPERGQRGATLQLGCAATIAERTGIPVVSDFRARDVAAGGEGAPLVPWADRLLFAAPGRCRALQNIGGMANVTWLPPRGEPEPVIAFDTGPGVALIDAAVELASGGRETYDRDGARAFAGAVDEALLAELLAHAYFDRPPPKSTGRELFGRSFVERLARRIRPRTDVEWSGLVATLTAFTAEAVADAYRRWLRPRGIDEVVLSGGGSRNPALREMLQTALAPIPVLLADETLGVDPDAKEAVAFAALAWAHALGLPANLPEATGAAGPRVLGSFTPGAPGRPPSARSSPRVASRRTVHEPEAEAERHMRGRAAGPGELGADPLER